MEITEISGCHVLLNRGLSGRFNRAPSAVLSQQEVMPARRRTPDRQMMEMIRAIGAVGFMAFF